MYRIVLVLLVVAVALGTSCYHPFGARNIGHRAGADVLRQLPENSLSVLEAALQIQDRKDFLYLEFDVRETLDHQLVVFHDRTLGRMMGGVADETRVSHMTLAEIRAYRFRRQSEEGIPTLEEFLDKAIACDLHKPMVIEIKSIRSEGAMEELLLLVDRYLERHGTRRQIVYEAGFDFPKRPVTLMSFPSHFPSFLRDSQQQAEYWSGRLRDLGIAGVYRAKHHSICLFR